MTALFSACRLMTATMEIMWLYEHNGSVDNNSPIWIRLDVSAGQTDDERRSDWCYRSNSGSSLGSPAPPWNVCIRENIITRFSIFEVERGTL